MTEKCVFVVVGEETIHCESCEARVGNALRRLSGVKAAEASHRTQEVRIQFDPGKTSREAIRERLEELGYEVRAGEVS